jgi:hypothetical protein
VYCTAALPSTHISHMGSLKLIIFGVDASGLDCIRLYSYSLIHYLLLLLLLLLLVLLLCFESQNWHSGQLLHTVNLAMTAYFFFIIRCFDKCPGTQQAIRRKKYVYIDSALKLKIRFQLRILKFLIKFMHS